MKPALEPISRRPAVRRRHRMRFGAEVQRGGQVRFALWAPAVRAVDVVIDDAEALPLAPTGEGWFGLTTDRARAGSRYRFVLPDGLAVPDPASRFQPADVQGPSEVIDPEDYGWADVHWPGRPWCEAVVYELHVGAFTPEGTFRACAAKLDHLAALGVTAVELMPVADFPGARNWGYDGVLPFAPDSSYGRPEDLKALVAAAHARGLMLLLDVVYNHFGPQGNYLTRYAPAFSSPTHRTPWGSALNFDGEGSATVREFFIENALYWLEEFHLDGLRLDAVHAIIDAGEPPFLRELALRVRRQIPGRPIHLVLENHRNEARWMEAGTPARPDFYTAQWNDDLHHVLHAAATGERDGYYADYVPLGGRLARGLAEGFVYQGELAASLGAPRGEPSLGLPTTAFVAFLQNHDQTGNRAFGERLGALVPTPLLRALAAVYLMLPQTPMLFMGEEWGCLEPFAFFADFSGELGAAVRDGRRREFARFAQFRDADQRQLIPDPLALETFARSKLDWTRLEAAPHRALLELYHDLLALRRRVVLPLLAGLTGRDAEARTLAEGAVTVRFKTCGGVLQLDANLSAEPARGFLTMPGDPLWTEGEVGGDGVFGPWTVRWSLAPAVPA